LAPPQDPHLPIVFSHRTQTLLPPTGGSPS